MGEVVSSGAPAPVGPVLTSIEQLDEAQIRPDSVRRLSSARVALADYRLLQHDFPELSDAALLRRFPALGSLPEDKRRRAMSAMVDRWLVEHAGLISEAQLGQNVVNSEIVTTGPALPCHRPPGYGRSAIVALDEIRAADWSCQGEERGGLLDLKGVGVAAGTRPHAGPYGSGLEYLGVALGDYLLKRLVDAIFTRTVPSLSTVPVYAVLDLGFDIVNGWNGTGPAGVHVRRAHRRPPGGSSIPASGSNAEAMSTFIELLLRSYGLTSVNNGNCLTIEEKDGELSVTSSGRDITLALDADDLRRLREFKGDRGDLRIERINIQLTRDVDAGGRVAQMFDFGHVNVRAEFHNPLASTVSDSWLCIGGVLWPGSASFVMPDPRLSAPLAGWHKRAVNELCFGLAREVRAGTRTSGEVKETLEAMLGELVSSWSEREASDGLIQNVS
ncbi:hypothetical protein WME95_05510 [Sorangium sp. So ce327]|jgi:hypothetical protein|uniref:hypothetical protein n=1 Tax=Sorangium sp. So ce327 TaxID=3133301 RepID=UPI003F60BFA6